MRVPLSGLPNGGNHAFVAYLFSVHVICIIVLTNAGFGNVRLMGHAPFLKYFLLRSNSRRNQHVVTSKLTVTFLTIRPPILISNHFFDPLRRYARVRDFRVGLVARYRSNVNNFIINFFWYRHPAAMRILRTGPCFRMILTPCPDRLSALLSNAISDGINKINYTTAPIRFSLRRVGHIIVKHSF